MYNTGPDTNNSQFMIHTGESKHHDGRNVVIGEVIDGMDVVLKLNSFGSRTGEPKYIVEVKDCGEMVSKFSKAKKRLLEEGLPKGWEKKASRSNEGVFYFVNVERKATSWHDPRGPPKRPRHDAKPDDKTVKGEEKPKGEQHDRPCEKGEVRVLHILRKHRDVRYPTSWRCKDCSLSDREAKHELQQLRVRLHNVKVGGGDEALKKKFANIARVESDDDDTYKKGGDLMPFKRGVKHRPLEKFAFACKVGELSEVIETSSGFHLVLRIE